MAPCDVLVFFFSSRRRHTRCYRDWSSDVCSSDLSAFGPRVLRAPKALDRVRPELDEYFAGRRHAFDLELDLRATPEFHRRVLTELNRVEYGHTTTYGTLAAQVGAPRAARAVGTVMNRNPLPIVLPCHRVVGANGSLTGYGGGLDRKEWLLRLEGALL